MQVRTVDPVAQLKEQLGERWVIDDPQLIRSYGVDWTGRFHGTVLCVVRPINTWQIQRVLEIARNCHTPVYVHGGNTGLAGGATPVKPGIVVTMQRFDQVEIDPISKTALVGAGCQLDKVNQSAAQYGLQFAVDIASRGSATIGGMVATNAGGIHVIRHGSTRHQLLGIEAVFGTGNVVSRLEGLFKDNSGYDWPSLLCGSEGTLAIITQVVIKLIDIPCDRVVSLIGMETLQDAVSLQARLRQRFDNLDAIEFMTAEGIELVGDIDHKSWPLKNLYPIVLLVELAGKEVSSMDLAEFLDGSDLVHDAVFAEDSLADSLWYWRELHSEAISKVGVPHKFDVSFSPQAIPSFVDAVDQFLAEEYEQVKVIFFGHLGDGNVHVNLLGDDLNDDLDEAILALVASFSGSISAEHGIGRAKAKFLSLTRSPQDIDAMLTIKRALDPSRILSPGVIFEAKVDDDAI